MRDIELENGHVVFLSVNATPGLWLLCAASWNQIRTYFMSRQKHSNPLRDPELPARFARLLGKYLRLTLMSDEQLKDKMNEVAGAGSGSLASIRRHKDGSGGAPSHRMIGIYQAVLGIPEKEIDLTLYPDRSESPDSPSIRAFNEQ